MKNQLGKYLSLASLFIYIVSATTPSLHAQPHVEWTKAIGGTNGNYAFGVSRTPDGGYMIGGDGYGTGGREGMIVKLNSEGQLLWSKNIGGDGVSAIIQTSDGGSIVAGRAATSNLDIWVAKLSSAGEVEWSRTLGGSAEDGARSIVQAADGGYVVAGYTLSTDGDGNGNHGSSDFFVVKLNDKGETVWKKTLGGSKMDDAWSVARTSDNGFVVAGETYSNDGSVEGNHDTSGLRPDYWIVRLDQDGNTVWTKTLGGSGYEQAFSIIQTTEGGFAVAGQALASDGDVVGNHGDADFWVVKLSSSGDIQWSKSLGGTGGDVASSIIQTSEGKYIVAGYTYSQDFEIDSGYTLPNGDVHGNHGHSDYWVVKLSADGQLDWSRALGGSGNELAFSVVQTGDSPDLGYVVVGYSSSNDGDLTGSGFTGADEFWAVKLAGDDPPLSVPEHPGNLPANLALFQNYPNPFNPVTVIRYQLPASGHVIIKVFSVLGQEVRTLVDEFQEAGDKRVSFDAAGLAGGIYFYRLSAGEDVDMKKFVLMK